MANPALIQHASNSVNLTSGTTGTLAVTFASNITPGNCLVAAITVIGSTQNPSVTSVDTNGAAENWTQAVPGTLETGAGHIIGYVYVDPNTTAAGPTKIVNVHASWASALTAGNNGVIFADVYEFSNVASVSPVDKTSGSGGSSASTFTSGVTAATTQAVELIVGVAISTNIGAATLTGPSAPWTNETKLTGTWSSGSGGVSHLSGFKVVTATGTQVYSGTTSSGVPNSAAVVCLFGAATTITAAIATTDAADTIAATGAVAVSATVAIADAADTITASGGTGPAVTASIALIDAGDRITASGGTFTPVTAAISMHDAADRIAATASATAPDLLIAIAPVAGTDSFGNDYPAGVTIFVPVTLGAQTGIYAVSLGNLTSPYSDFAALTFTNISNPAFMPPAIAAASDAAGSGIELVSGNASGATPATLDLLDSALGGVAGGLATIAAGLTSLSGQLTVAANAAAPTFNGVPLAQVAPAGNSTPVSGSPPTGGTAATGVAGALNTYLIALAGNVNTLSSVVSNIIAQMVASGVWS